MAPFNRDYDRDFGYRGSAGYSERNAESGWGDRLENSARRGWDRLTHRTPDTSARSSYDRDLGYRGGSSSQWGSSSGYDRNLYRQSASSGDTAYGYGSTMRGFRGYGADYGRDFNSIYDRGYKSRMETETGDPFNDRGANTPIRLERGGYRSYGRDYSSNPVSYEPNDFRYGRYRNRGEVPPPPYDRDFRGMDRGYDRGWF